MATGKVWTREEMILVLGLYLRLPFGKFHKANPDVIRMANLMERSPSSVAMRLSNYAALDPLLQARGISGLRGGVGKCKAYWDEFMNNREELVFECERIRSSYEQTDIENKYRVVLDDIPEFITGKTREQLVRVRVNQSVFREIVLANYNQRCALTGIDIPELLVASHIIPWASNVEERMNPKNGICLSALYDKAFDRGLISFSDQYRVIMSSQLEDNVGKEYYASYFKPIAECSLATQGLKYPADPRFLEWHRDCIFQK